MHFRADALSFTIAYCLHIFVGNTAVIYAVKKLIPETRLRPKMQPAIVAGLAVALIARWAFLPWATGPFSLGGRYHWLQSRRWWRVWRSSIKKRA